jgi:RNA polymerase sigma factor (sigma-70 family)
VVVRADWEDQFVDLVQLTFVQLYRRWPGIRDETVDAYARQVLVNAFLTHRRARRRESLTADPPERAADGADPTDGLAVRRALAGLAPRQRAAVVLRYLEDLPVAEVATLLDVSEGTVKSQTARAIQSMRGALDAAAFTGE